MPQAEHQAQPPLALAIMREELAASEAQFDAAENAADRGEADSLRLDLDRAIDRYLRLESEVFYPVLQRIGVDHGRARASTESLRRELQAASQQPAARAGLRSAFQRHRQAQEQDTFPRAATALGAEPGLSAELEEVRSRMKGAFGV